MPELPEVETTRRGLAQHLSGCVLSKIDVRQPNLRWLVVLPESLLGQRLLGVTRRAKYLLLRFASGNLIIHLGMSGSLRILTAYHPAGKHDHIDLIFSETRSNSPRGNSILRYTDPRRFGSFHYQPGAVSEHWLLQKLGVEPLAQEFSGLYLYHHAQRRKTAIKNLLMNHQVVVGIGNIYASEALFRAAIRPNVRASRLTRAGAERLVISTKETLEEAILSGGTTLQDFTATDGRPGYFRQQLYVYGRTGKPCRLCGTSVKRVATGQRMSFYCPKCQS